MIIVGLNKALHHLEERIKDKLSESGYPSGSDEHRPNYVSIEDSAIVQEAKEVGEDKYEASISYGGEDAPYALAYEFGSGEQGGGKRYEIFAVNTDALYFYWEKIQAWTLVPKTPTRPTYYLPYSNLLVIGKGKVDHPGIKPKPYAIQTLINETDTMLDMIGQEFRAEISAIIDETIKDEILEIRVF